MNSFQFSNKAAYMLGVTALYAASLAMGQSSGPSASDKKFVQEALEGGTAEVQLGQLALQKGNSDDVKQFGQRMVDDHTRLGDQMRQIAQKERITPPAGISMKDKALAARLKSLSGHSFDKAYIEAMVRDHRADLMAFKKEASTGTDSSLKDAASRGSEVISNHLHMIEDIAKSHSVTVGQ